MNFNSFDFFVFLVFSLLLHAATPHRYRNVFYALSGFYFYSFWSLKFTSLLVISSAVDYFLALAIEKASTPISKRKYLIASVVMNLGFLGFFKYFNFFVDNVYFFFDHIGLTIPHVALRVVLPVGISFYTFQELSYTIDVYRGQCKARTNYFDVAAFVAFFPQLVAGPIERAEHLMDQLEKKDKKPQWKSGAQLILWGLFQKVVIADNVAVLANFAFNPSSGVLDTGVAIVGAYAFAIQIYCDFAGYTDIARGVAKWFGVDIMLNFNLPYFALCIRDFWARWHISLSTWLKDYLYIPLGGNRGSQTRTSINLMITMLLGGLWHGATWMFVLWGMYQGILLLIEHHLNIDPKRLRTQSLPMRILYGALTFQLVCFGWVLFRATNLDIFTHWITMFASMKFDPTYFALWGSLAFYSLPLLFVWIVQATKGLNDRLVYGLPTFARIAFTVILLAGLYFLSAEAGREFIYFQF